MSATSFRHLAWLPMAVAIGLISAANGFYEPSLGIRGDDLSSQLGIRPEELGRVYASFAIGLIPGAILNNLLVPRYGTRMVMVAGTFLFWGPMLWMAEVIDGASSGSVVTTLQLAWIVAGAGCGMVDLSHALHANKYDPERQSVQWFLAVKACGAAAASVFGTWAMSNGWPVHQHIRIVGLICLVGGFVGAWRLPNLRPEQRDRPAQLGAWGIPILGGLMALSVIPIGAAFNWTTSVLGEELDVAAETVGLGQLAFTLPQLVAMCLACTPWARQHVVRYATAGLWVAAIGIAILVTLNFTMDGLSRGVVVALIFVGLGLLGFGIAPVPGLAQSATMAASERGLMIVVLIQFVATASANYLIGLVGGVTGLFWAFAGVNAICVLGIAAGRPWLRHAGPQPA